MSLAHQPGSPTSQAAAASMEEHAPSQKQKVLDFVIQCGVRGATREEVSLGLGISIQSVTPLVNDLVSHRQLVKSTATPTRKTTTGRDAEVLIGKAFAQPMQSSMFGTPRPAPRKTQYS